MEEQDFRNVHRHASFNRDEIERSSWCGCFYCKEKYPVADVEDYIDDGQTALCPHCGIDAVIGDASGVALTPQLFSGMYQKYF